MASRKGTLLPKWLQGNNGHLSINSYTKLENRRDYVAPTPYKAPPVIRKVVAPIVKPTINNAFAQRKSLNASRGYEQPSNAINPPTVNTPRKIVQQGKVPIKGLQRPNNPFAPALVNFANTASLGLLEANNKGIQQLHQQSPISSTIGSMAGYVMPYGIGSKLARPITSKFVKPLAKRLIEGAMVGSGVELASGVIGQRGVKQTAKNVAIGGALGAVGDVALHGAGKLLSNSAKNYKGLLNLDGVKKINTPLPKARLNLKMKPKVETKIETPLKPQIKINNASGKLKPQILQMKSDTLPLKQRTLENVGNKKVNAYTYDNPTLHSYVADEANIIKGEIARGSKPVNAGATHYDSGYGGNVETKGYGKIDAVRSETTAELSKATGGTYAEIDKALDDIIHDKGKENYALAKRVELAIDDRLTNGYREDILGHDIPPHNNYIEEKSFIDGMPQQLNTSTIKRGNLKPQFKSQSNIKVESTNTPIVNKKLSTDTIRPPANTKVSQFKTNTLRNSEFLADKETQKVIDNIAMEYEVKPNAQTVNRAIQEVANDFDGVMNRIKNTEVVSGQGALQSAEDSTSSALITNRLRQQAKETGNYTELKAWLEVLQPKVTNTAQSLQALKTWKDLSPEGTIFKAQQVVGEVNRAGVKTYGKNFTPIELTTTEIKHIGDSMEDVMKMPETTPNEIKAKERAFDRVKQIIGDKIPATLADKVKALQRISLLLNPKTNIRNVLGNTLLGTLENTKDFISAPVDMLTSALKTGKRTTLLPSLKGLQTQGKGMVKGFKTVAGDVKMGVNTSQSRGQFEISGDRIFKSNALNKLDKATNTALRFGDEPFYQAAYDESLRQQLKIAKTTKPTKEMLAAAKEFAQDRTLQNTSSISEGFKGIQKSINKLTGNENIGLGTFAVPFVKTPANILDKAIDYSPIGSLKAITQLIGNKKIFNQKLFVDRVGRSVVGTGGIMLGYDLAKKGVITGAQNKDVDVASLDRQMGKAAYSFVSGDTYKTFDWAAPASIMLAIGADMYQEGKTDKDVGSVAVKAITSGAGTLFKQSLLQGFQRLFGYNDLVGGIVNTAMNVPTQFVPTALKQASQLKDANLKDTYDPNSFKKLRNQLQAKIPGLSSKLPTRIDTLGREIKQFQGKNNAFNVLGNPSFTTKLTGNATERFVSKLYEETGLKTHFPKVAKSSITYKADSKLNQTINLTPTEKIQFQKYIGQRTDKEFQVIAKTYTENEKNNRTSTSAIQQVKDLGSLLTDIYTEGEKKILEARGIKEWNSKTYGKTLGNNPRN